MVAGHFPGATKKAALKDAQAEGWRWAEKNGVTKTYCPQHVPGRATMTLECSGCHLTQRHRVWDEQDGYATARVAGWSFDEEKCLCPKCAVKLVVLQ